MYDILEQFCNDNNFPFVYARRDFANLYDEIEQKLIPHFFLDPVVIESSENDMGVTENETHSGSFMILVSSDIDELSYNDRYQKYIKPLIATSTDSLKDFLRCNFNLTINQWRTVEVINVFDYNFDGIIVNYNVTIEA